MWFCALRLTSWSMCLTDESVEDKLQRIMSEYTRMTIATGKIARANGPLEGLALLVEILPPCEIPFKVGFRLHERRTCPPEWNLAIDYPKSRRERLEIFHVNTLSRSGPLRRAENKWMNTCVLDLALLEGLEDSHVKPRWNSVHLPGPAVVRGLARLRTNTSLPLAYVIIPLQHNSRLLLVRECCKTAAGL